jgi:hypothetical protein
VLIGSVSRSAAYTITNATSNNTFQFDTVQFDPYGMWYQPTYQFVAPVGGTYLCNCCMNATPASGVTPAGGISTDAAWGGTSTVGMASQDGWGAIRCIGTAIIRVTVGQHIAWCTLFTTPNTTSAPPGSWLTVQYLGTG